MCDKSTANYEDLMRKLQQHEELITQLLEIIAITNRKVFELTNNQENKKPVYLLT